MMISDKNWIMYVLQCSDGTLYTGITNSIEKRMLTHNAGKGSKYTRSRLPCRVVAKSSCFSKSQCASAEVKFKKLKRKKKESFLMDGLDTFFETIGLFPKDLDHNEQERNED